MKYEILFHENLFTLMDRVNAHLAEGWKLQGGICEFHNKTKKDGHEETHSYLAQAMTKVDDVCFCGEENLVQKEIQECQKLIAQKLKP